MTHNLWSASNVPEPIKKHQYLFDMGYPYYMKVFGNILALTTDLGLCVFRLWIYIQLSDWSDLLWDKLFYEFELEML